MRTRPTVVVQKTRSDHAGALEHWKALMSEWSVVHNDDEGLPPPTICPPEQGASISNAIFPTGQAVLGLVSGKERKKAEHGL